MLSTSPTKWQEAPRSPSPPPSASSSLRTGVTGDLSDHPRGPGALVFVGMISTANYPRGFRLSSSLEVVERRTSGFPILGTHRVVP